MKRESRGILPALLCATIACLICGKSQAQTAGVPALPSANADYVGYAVTDLPAHFSTGAVAAADNTPSTNPITNAAATLGRQNGWTSPFVCRGLS